MTQTPATPENPDDGFEMLSTPPTSPDLGASLKAKKGVGGLPKSTLILVGVVLLGGSFVGGLAVGKANASTSTAKAGSSTGAGVPGAGTRSRGAFGGTGGTAGAGARGGAGGVTGTVQSVDGTTIYVTDSTGKVTKVDTSANTTVTVSKTGALSDLTPGSKVTVIGAAGSDGTVTARSVVSGDGTFGFGGGRGGTGFGGAGSAPTTTGG